MGNLELITCLILSQTSKRQVIDIPVYPFNLKCYLCQHPEVLQLRLSMHLNYAQFVVIDFVCCLHAFKNFNLSGSSLWSILANISPQKYDKDLPILLFLIIIQSETNKS